MPTYTYRCESDGDFDLSFPMAEVPERAACRVCDSASRRVFTGPHLSAAGTPAYGLVERTKQSAHEPPVLDRIPGRPRAVQKTTSNPLHAKLPRP